MTISNACTTELATVLTKWDCPRMRFRSSGLSNGTAVMSTGDDFLCIKLRC